MNLLDKIDNQLPMMRMIEDAIKQIQQETYAIE